MTLPDDERPVPHVVCGEFRAERPCGELNPVLWLMLVRHGVPVRGPAPADLRLRLDPQRLRAYNLTNLDSYWRPLAGQVRAEVAGRDPHAPAHAGSLMWVVLGPPRLHHTLATGGVISKSAAAPYLARWFPAFADLADRVGRARQGAKVGFQTADALSAAELVDAVADDARRRFGHPVR